MLSKEDYTEEIGLIKKQNYVEVELYPLVADIIKPTLKDSLSKDMSSEDKEGVWDKFIMV